MTSKRLLTRAIKKAKQNGLKFRDGIAPIDPELTYLGDPLPPAFIFNHQFAKALWGIDDLHLEADVEPYDSFDGEKNEHDVQIVEVYHYENWQWHLMQMVIADDPIKYLGEHLDD